MSPGPDFDELVGGEVGGAERERLRRTHELLVAAGPPPELAPELEAGPTLAMTLGRAPGGRRHRLTLLAAAVVVLVLVFLGGYIAGNRGGSSAPRAVQALELRGTSAAPKALGSLRIEPADRSGNWPMTLSAAGLPALPRGGYYEVYLVRRGQPWALCGAFAAQQGAAVTVRLNAPYALRRGDTWVVTRQVAGHAGSGVPVLRAVA